MKFKLTVRRCAPLLFLLLCGRIASAAEALASRDKAPLTILQMNDVYSTAPVDGGKAGGLARVAGLAAEMKKAGRPVVVTMSGDFCRPRSRRASSRASR
jgi:5'-nucleotidase